ncbi:MAG TPA: protein kinase, partial [Planctomycetota bacterium]
TDDPCGALTIAELEARLARAAGAAEEAPAELAVGQRLDGKYEIEALLAEGGFGRVYRARDLALDCPVAIKVLKHGREEGPRSLAALEAEARHLTRLRHPNIVEWKALNRSTGGRLYLVMEFLEGELLEHCLQREGRLAPARAARILLALLDAMAHAHELPEGGALLHLDLKPSNVFLVRARPGEERVKVLDFGISRFASQVAARPGPPDPATGDAGATTTFATAGGSLACTPQYCAPEQAARALGRAAPPLDGRVDLFALGVIGYRMLSGQLPWPPATDVLRLLRERCEKPAPPLPPGTAPRALARFVERCLALEPGARFASARAAHAALARTQAPRTHGWLAAAASLLALALVLRATLWAPPEAPAPMTVHVEGVAEGEPLWFGPARPAQRIEVPEPRDGLRLVREPRSGAPALDDWRLEVRPDGALELVAEPGSAPRRSTAYLLQGEGAGLRASAPLLLAYVPAGSWELLSADVVGRGTRAVAPRGQRLEVRLRGPSDVLPEVVALRLGRARHELRRSPLREGEQVSVYRMELDALAGSAGSDALVLELADRAGNELQHELELALVREPLRLEQAELEGVPRVGSTWHLLAGEPARLRVACNRPARLAWALLDAEGRELDAGRTAPGPEHRLALDTQRWPQRAFRGELVLRLDEDEAVLHAGEDGRVVQRLALEQRTSGAEFDLALAGGRAWVEPGRAEPVQYVASGALRIAIFREHDVPMCVRLRGPTAEPQPETRFTAALEERKTLELELAQDGLHELELCGQRLGTDGEPLAAVDALRRLVVVRDTRAPRVEPVDWPAEAVLRSAAELAAAELPLRIAEERWSPGAPPVELAWSLFLTRAARPAQEHAAGTLELPAEALVPVPLGRLASSWPEGTYELRLRARDFAGNADEERRITWSVSTEGPSIEVVVPASGEAWARSSERFVVELRAEDPNGVAGVECTLDDPTGQLASQTIALARVDQGVPARWSGSFVLDQRWSGRPARLRLVGTDAHGTPTLVPPEIQCTVGSIPSMVPDRIEVARAGRPTTHMRRVPGNHAAPYLFGGRGDPLENAAFRAHGLPDFSSRALASSLRIECPPGTLADFYLDEHEVTVERYLAFLAAARGTDLGLDASRRDALERHFAALDPTLPATGLTLGEAQAFADWCGLVLPTYLQWEYAVRGATARPCSFAEVFVPAMLGTSVNVGTPGPWPVERGLDRTPDTGIANLCSNVAEWTATPAEQPLEGLTPARLLVPVRAAASARHFVVGGAFDRQTFHFATLARRDVSRPSAAIGFRCLLSAARVEQAFLEPADELRVRSAP